MKNFNLLLTNEEVISRINSIRDDETDRIFCKHDLYHFLSVARIAYILCLESALDIPKDVIYSTALLHDLGRYDQVRTGDDHALASAKLANELLSLTDFTDEQKNIVISAIKHHRKDDGASDFDKIFYKADKMSRECRFCESASLCNWTNKEKNINIIY